MGLLCSIFKESRCINCNVPRSYYSTKEHSERMSCRASDKSLLNYHVWSR